jgi:hypothetical protein
MEKPEYIIVQWNRIKEFQDKVNDKIKEGYKPLGGVCFNSWYYQAMILDKGQKP